MIIILIILDNIYTRGIPNGDRHTMILIYLNYRPEATGSIL